MLKKPGAPAALAKFVGIGFGAPSQTTPTIPRRLEVISPRFRSSFNA
jgi:hypothetical protein